MLISEVNLRLIIKKSILESLSNQINLLEIEDQNASEKDIKTRSEDLRKRLDIFTRNIDKLKENYPDIYESIVKEHSGFVDGEKKAKEILDDVRSSSIKGDEIIQLIDSYNMLAPSINSTIKILKSEMPLSKESSEMIKKVAEDVYYALFPESKVSVFVKWTTGKTSLEDYQKWLIVPAEGIESAVENLVSLLNPKTWIGVKQGVKTLYEMTPEERSAAHLAIKEIWKNIPPERLAIDGARWLSSVIFLCGGAEKLGSIAKLKLPVQITEVLYILRNLSKFKSLPILVIDGLKLEPI